MLNKKYMNSQIINLNVSKKQIFFSVLLVCLLATSAWAQTENGKNIVGFKETTVQGFDNSLLINTDLEKLDMVFRIEKIEEDNDYYYVDFTYFDLVKKESTWEWQAQARKRKISKKIDQDLGVYLAEEFKQSREDRIVELKEMRNNFSTSTPRMAVTRYNGLIGKTLDIASNIFPGYEPEKKEVINAEVPVLPQIEASTTNEVDNLKNIYDEYIQSHDDLLTNLPNSDDQTTTSTASSSENVITTDVPMASTTPTEDQRTVEIIEPDSVTSSTTSPE